LNFHQLRSTGLRWRTSQFIQDLREFFEGQGYSFHDEETPGAKAKSRGDVFPAGVVGKSASSTEETSGSTSGKPGKLARPQTANLQFMRITPMLESDQVDRVFDCIEANEAALTDAAGKPVVLGFLSDSPDSATQAKAIAVLRRLAENGLLYARLMGRELLPADQTTGSSKVKTVGDLLTFAMADLQRGVVDGDKDAQARRKSRAEPVEVLQALVG